MSNYKDSLNSLSFQPAADEPAWLAECRQRAFERFKSLGLPTRKMEAWKYMSLEPVFQMRAAAAPKAVDKKWLNSLPGKKSGNLFVFLNGVYSPEESSAEKSGVQWISLKAERTKPASLEFELETNPFNAVNAFSFDDAFLLRVPKDTRLEAPVRFLFASQGDSEASPVSYPRIFIEAGAGSKSEIVLEFADADTGRYFMDAVVDFRLEANASVSVSQAQMGGRDGILLLTSAVRQADGSALEWTAFSHGSCQVRNEITVNLEGKQASCDLHGLALLDGKSQIFHHAFVHHIAPHCMSRQAFKNIMTGETVAEFDSLVHVRRGANQSDSRQMDRNLLLSRKARAFSRPQLMIGADDVKANHGAATGKLEKDEMFYLRSRGLSEKTARFLMTYGFAEEVLQEMGDAELRERLEDFVRGKVEALAAEEAL